MSSTLEKRGEVLNKLLRGEISAVETYEQALEKIDEDPRAAQLRQIRDEHQAAVNHLRSHVQDHTTEQPDDGSGWWGTWAKTVQGVAKLFGDKSSMKALKEGEEHGVKQYEDALEDENLSPDCKTLISTELLPQTRSHIQTLDRLMESCGCDD